MSNQPSPFFVHIIESPSPADLLNGLTEGRMLCNFLEIARIPCLYNLAVDLTQFNEAMTNQVRLGVEWFQVPPILHISAHGDENGIQLTHQYEAGELLAWAELAKLIKPISQDLSFRVGVCMSTCGGAHGRKMAQVLRTEDIPMAWIVGTATSVSISDAALAFAVFYRGLQRGSSLNDLVVAMRVASGVSDFNVDFGHLVQQQYAQVIHDLLQSLRQPPAQQPPPPQGLPICQPRSQHPLAPFPWELMSLPPPKAPPKKNLGESGPQ